MQQKTKPENFSKILPSATALPFDIKAMMDAQRKNYQALQEANQCAVQGWQALAQRQVEMATEFVQNNSALTLQALTEASPEEKIAQQAQLVKTAYEKSILNTQELTDLLRQCTIETSEVINKRVYAGLNEIKAASKDAAKD